jgi:alkylation response protein AidB-like acyl-CoA dehydrogenase
MPNFFLDNDDLRFHFEHTIDWTSLVEVGEYGFRAPDGPKDVAEAVTSFRDVAELIGAFAAEEIAPRAARIDREGARLEHGEAVPGAAFTEVFAKMRALDLYRLPLPRELGGMNAPLLLYFLGNELLARADVSVMAHYSFHAGIAMALLAYSLDEGTTRVDVAGGRIVATRFAKEVEEIASGAAWGCMDITEPDAGSDMAALRTSAEQAPDGSWTVTGQKIFITSGHGKYHIVVARTEKDAGLGGLSLFLVPTYEDGPDGRRVRHVTLERVEEKLGHHGSVTAALSFDRAPAQLIGKRGEGFRQMLLLMNNARLAIGFESLGLCEAAYRMAHGYAAERRSMGKPIAQHEMIADYLDEMRTDIQGLRALALDAACHEELAFKLGALGRFATAPTPLEARHLARLPHHRARARRATPLLKYLAAEKAVEMARRAIQIHGGIGYTTEIGAEKLLRDAIVMPIYEGTSQIQALMATKDVLGALVKRPHELLGRLAQARWRSLSAKDELDRRLARLSLLALGAQQHLVTRTAASKLRTLADVPLLDWKRALTEDWDPRRDFALALLHAERLTRLLADEMIVEILVAQARRFPERRELAVRYLDRAEPRCRMLHDEITTTGGRLLESVGEAIAARRAG